MLAGLAGGGLVAGCSSSTTSARTPSPSVPAPSSGTSVSPAPTSLAPSSPATPPAGPPNPQVAGTIASGLEVPWGLTFLPGGDALVSERNSGRILRITPAGGVTPLGTVPGVQAPTGSGEGGLLGLVLDGRDPSVLYAYLSTADDNRVVRISVAGGRLGASEPVLTGIPRATFHNGGRLLMTPDQTLLVTTGDAGVGSRAQNKASLAGKILRITTDGQPAPGNPFGTHVWSYGHRNAQGLAYDAEGRLWSSEFGEKASDELNLITPGGNYGWPAVEGASNDPAYVAPAVTWSPTSTSSPSGLAITRGHAYVAALMGRCLFQIPLQGATAGQPTALFAGEHGRLRTVAAAPDGSLWVTTSNRDGRVSPGPDDDKILRVTL